MSTDSSNNVNEDLLQRIRSLEERVSQLEKTVLDLDQVVKEHKSKIATLKEVSRELADMYEQHIHGKWTLEEIKLALENIQQLASMLQSAGMLSSQGGSEGNLLQKMLLEEYMRTRQGPLPSADVPVKPLSRKESAKLKKVFQEKEKEEGEEEEEEEEEEE